MRRRLREFAIVEETTSILRHDVRNKLATIRNAIFFLRKRVGTTPLWESEPRVQQFFQVVEAELAGAEQILTERTRAGCLPAAKREARRLREIVAEALAAFPPDRIESDLADEVELEIDAAEIRLLVEALVENALEAAPPPAKVRVETRGVPDGMTLRVRDGGPGFPAELGERAKDPFVGTWPGHAGLGLAIVRRLAARNGAEFAPLRAGESTVEIRFRRPAPPQR